MCKAIDDPTTGNDTLAKLYGAASVYYNYTGTATCFDLDDDSDPHGLGGWSWQVLAKLNKSKPLIRNLSLFFFLFKSFTLYYCKFHYMYIYE